MNKIKLKGHESFVLRDGWLEKGLNLINNNCDFFKKDNAQNESGLGTNMVKSLKYYLELGSLITTLNKGVFLTEIGKKILELDPFLENTNTWWLIHYLFVKNIEKSFVLNNIFNAELSNFTKEDLIKYFKNMLKNEEYNETSLIADVNIFLSLYTKEKKDSDPEGNILSPLTKLNVLLNNDEIYKKNICLHKHLNPLVIYYNLIDVMHENVFNVEDLLKVYNSPINLFNINKSILFYYLDELKKMNLIDVVKTAGLNEVTIKKRLDLADFFLLLRGEVYVK